MRQVMLDTETTGLDPNQGHRMVEIAAVEIVNRRLTGNHFQRYLNPQRAIDPAAQEVHGLSLEFLQDMPCFHEIVDDFLAFIKDAEVFIHNAAFDEGFLNAELNRIGRGNVRDCAGIQIYCTLALARGRHPGQKNNLNALCSRYQVDHSGRQRHGALLDAELLAAVYLAMTRGQESLMMDGAITDTELPTANEEGVCSEGLIVIYANEQESMAHDEILRKMNETMKTKACVWQSLALSDGAIQPNQILG